MVPFEKAVKAILEFCHCMVACMDSSVMTDDPVESRPHGTWVINHCQGF